MSRASRDKGQRGERELAKLLAVLTDRWPECGRNIDQFGPDKRDLLNTPGFHWQVKRQERVAIWEALQQAEAEARDGDVPVVAFRRNRSRWKVALDLEDFLRLLG